jgi:multifunctional methyltransferase subunit TRM112
MCNLKTCIGVNLPLTLQVNEMSEENTEYNAVLTTKMLGKIDWKVFVRTVEALGHTLPEELSAEDLANENLMKNVYHLLFNLNVVSGSLICQNCGRVYPIEKSIPNMLLEDREEA